MSFEGYILKLRDFTHGEEILNQLRVCRSEVCNALWGSNNGDIAGPGVVTSYIVNNSLSLLSIIALSIYWEASRYSLRSLLNNKIERQIGKCIGSLYLCIVWLCVSTQIASIVFLVRVDFGLNASGMEFPSMEITWAVSTLMLLPLLHLCFLPNQVGYRDGGLANPKPFSSDIDSQKILKPSESEIFRFQALSFCWLLSGYPFLSRVLETFSPSKIGEDSKSIITTSEWSRIQELCLDGVKGITIQEQMLFTRFGVASWIWVTIFTLAGLVRVFLTRREYEESKVLDKITRATSISPAIGIRSKTLPNFVRFSLMVINPVLAGVSMWAIFRLQQYQGDILEKAEDKSEAPDWSFGQVMALLVYGPVCLELYKLGRMLTL
ncbi:hypothetical protein TWF569_005520 [Orbilia oligospora]|uniref:Uncharacterized protein n=1 Tax=Orbilia oligospora TaxID=2813651 RepID=A0A7C8JST0_ORBOL|nr:hypothetical protein TWF102_011406 [Orbilia oligospora]KAF3115728.1 hypothetical protein TWF706_005833 [Orbilia oligospora]KAF3117990.1 hypothetical protein TWF103_000029 [Orbilia oligospora]KAF3141445.1 hypothetical protein TWF594_006000 [Orbilia oligospora]KAF3144180.1 hypothetical protein TWF703_009475 [Orbilia oligospora]